MTDEELGRELLRLWDDDPQIGGHPHGYAKYGRAARELLAPPRVEMMIEGMTKENWHDAFKPIYAGNNEFSKMDHAEACAVIAHRLAKTLKLPAAARELLAPPRVEMPE